MPVDWLQITVFNLKKRYLSVLLLKPSCSLFILTIFSVFTLLQMLVEWISFRWAVCPLKPTNGRFRSSTLIAKRRSSKMFWVRFKVVLKAKTTMVMPNVFRPSRLMLRCDHDLHILSFLLSTVSFSAGWERNKKTERGAWSGDWSPLSGQQDNRRSRTSCISRKGWFSALWPEVVHGLPTSTLIAQKFRSDSCRVTIPATTRTPSFIKKVFLSLRWLRRLNMRRICWTRSPCKPANY